MPIYNYVCNECNEEFEEYNSVSERHKALCSYCMSSNVSKLISTQVNVQIDSKYRDVRGDKIWFPKDNKPYFDKALNRTFSDIKEKQKYMKDNKLAMDGSSSKRISKLPPEAGDMKNRDYRKQYKLDQ